MVVYRYVHFRAMRFPSSYETEVNILQRIKVQESRRIIDIIPQLRGSHLTKRFILECYDCNILETEESTDFLQFTILCSVSY